MYRLGQKPRATVANVKASLRSLSDEFAANGTNILVEFQEGTPLKKQPHKVIIDDLLVMEGLTYREVIDWLQAARIGLATNRRIAQERTRAHHAQMRRLMEQRDVGQPITQQLDATRIHPSTHPHFPESGFPAN